ncbi:hypothetical protein GCM10020255_084140 [Rhodococcus baikonurensis]
MVKPQFEVGKDRVGAGGVVRDPELRISAVLDVSEAAAKVGLRTLGVVASPLPGPSGNVEYFLWLRKTGSSGDEETDAATDDVPTVEDMIRKAVEEGPQ